METKEILKEELAKSAERLKAKGVELGKEALEEVALEMSDCFSKVATRTEGKADDFFLVIKPMLDREIDKIDGKEG